MEERKKQYGVPKDSERRGRRKNEFPRIRKDEEEERKNNTEFPGIRKDEEEERKDNTEFPGIRKGEEEERKILAFKFACTPIRLAGLFGWPIRIGRGRLREPSSRGLCRLG
jgi:hypothetical protein